MINMKKTLLAIGLLTTIGVLVFLPTMIYGGFSVQTVEGTLTLNTAITSPLSESMTKQSLAPSIVDWDITLQNASQNAWKYAFSGVGGRNDVADDKPGVDVSLELSIIFNLTKDGETIKEINIGLAHGEGLHTIDVVLGPSEGLTTSGNYELYITISLRLSTPGGDLALDIELGPVTIYIEL